jgi:hypothetical protein
VEVGERIDEDRARKKTWDSARLQIDPVGVLGKHNGQSSAVDTPDEQILNLMDSGWHGCTVVLARAESHFLFLADQLEQWQANWQYVRHSILLMTVSSHVIE